MQAMAQAFTSNTSKQMYDMYMDSMRFNETERNIVQSKEFVCEIKTAVEVFREKIKVCNFVQHPVT